MPEIKFIPYVPKKKAKNKTRPELWQKRLDPAVERQKNLKVLRGSVDAKVSTVITSHTQLVISQTKRDPLAKPEGQHQTYRGDLFQIIPDPPTLLGYGGFDPFNVFCVQNQTQRTQEMLEKGMLHERGAVIANAASIKFLLLNPNRFLYFCGQTADT